MQGATGCYKEDSSREEVAEPTAGHVHACKIAVMFNAKSATCNLIEH